MAVALIRVEAGRATIYSSGSVPSLLDFGGLSSIVVTRTQDTPPGDPVQVDLSSIIEQVRGGCSITVQGGATADVGGGIINLGLGNSLKLDGGRLVIRFSLLSASAMSSITVGPNAGELRIEGQGLATRFDIPVKFVDEYGRPTTQIPANFVMDFPNTQSVGAVYDPRTNLTKIGDGIDALGIWSIGRTTTLQGDPFNLRATGTERRGFLGNITGYSYNFTRSNGHDDGRGGVITCYLPGSMVRTDTGTVAVETLAVGDCVQVFTADGQSQGLRRVTWIGQGRVSVQPDLTDDEAGWPVCIRRNALADNVPQKDMFVTAEHCLLLDGHFIPVRMLVNGSSIFYDRSRAEYDYWHFEVEPHGIVEVDGALTESYLETGNRHGFLFQAGQWAERVGRCWEKDAAAPLAVQRAFVEPVYHKIRERSEIAINETRDLVTDPDLTVLAPSGQALSLVRKTGQRYLFRLVGACDEVRLISRISRPCDVVGPFVDDRRWLGVLVSRVELFWENGMREDVTGFLSAPQQDGWYVQEASPCRWTNGKARLALPDRGAKIAQPLFLSIELLAAGPYLCEVDPVTGEGVRLSGGMC